MIDKFQSSFFIGLGLMVVGVVALLIHFIGTYFNINFLILDDSLALPIGIIYFGGMFAMLYGFMNLRTLIK